jgi:hypothetical protein
MRLLVAAILILFPSFLALVSAEAVEPNSCYVEGRVLSSEGVGSAGPDGIQLRVVFETTLAINDSVLPCFFHANEEVTALNPLSFNAPKAVLREGDEFSGDLVIVGDEWSQSNLLRDVVIKNAWCPVLENCGVECGSVEIGLAVDSRGCYECACPDANAPGFEAKERFFRFSFAAGWNFFSYPVAQERDAYCLPAANKPCLQEKGFLPRVIATDCDSESVVWRWADGGRAYSEFQFPDVGKKESVSFAGELFAGYWFKAAAPCSVLIAGDYVPFKGMGGKQLFKGWNAVGAASGEIDINYVKGDCVVEKGPYAWDAFKQKFLKAPKLEKGRAYFVKVNRDCLLSTADFSEVSAGVASPVSASTR